MFKTFFTVFLLIIFVFSMTSFAEKFDFQRVHKVTTEDEARFEAKLKNANSSLSFPKLPNELGRTWYDYATNSVMGRMMAYGSNGIHFTFMKRQPDAAGNRYVTYDYWDLGLALFFGNQSVTENQATGWGRAVNGKNNELLTVFHGGGLHLYQDAGEANYSFTEIQSTPGGVFPGLAVTGDTVFFIGQLANANWLGGDTIMVSTDYMQTWTGHNVWAPEDPAITDYGVAEMWPTFNPTVPGEISVVYAPNVTASAPNGSIKMATTGDFGASWTQFEIHNDDTIFPDSSQYIIENFSQMNSMYGMDGTYHVVIGAVQGLEHTRLSTQIDMHPLLYWNTREQTLVEISAYDKGHPADTTAQSLLQNNDPGNGLGGLNYPTLSEGPNGELVCIWQEWEDDGTGMPVMVTPSGGNPTFCTDIVGAYSPDAGLTWSEPFWLAGTASESDVYPNITKNFNFNSAGDSLVLDIAYMWDTNAGTSLFGGGNDASEVVWYYERVAVPVPVNGINEDIQVAEEFNLAQNYPNPFNPTTEIKFNISKASEVSLDVFNVLGEKVATLINGNVKAGEHTASFDGANFASGVYFYQLTAGNFVETRKMLLVK